MSEEQRSAQRIDLASPMDALLGDSPVRIIEISLIGCRVEHAEKISIGARLHLQLSHEGATLKLAARVARTELRGGAGALLYASGLELAKSLQESPRALVQLIESLTAEERKKAGTNFFMAPVPFMRQQDEEDEEIQEDEGGRPEREDVEVEQQPVQRIPDLESAASAVPAFELDIGMDLPIEVPPELQPQQQIAVTPALGLELDLGPRFDADETTSLRPGKHFLECTNSGGQWSRRVTDSPKQPRDGFTIPIEEESEADLYYRTYEAADEDMRRMIRLSLEISIARRKR
ncbi:MAG TPA: PilZ domain-containing protein [Thermoanaerobaculia bacterium]|nr:PilZ domain-containing protein [Thermoanaerobaculia bacterium]